MYPTIFHKTDCTLAQYLTEIMIIRQAKKQGLPLVDNFWSDPAWKVEYRNQIIAANTLIKNFPNQAIIIEVVKEFTWAYSLRTKKISEEIYTRSAKEKTKKEVREFVREEIVLEDKEVLSRRTSYKKKELDL